ncbi:pilus assembly PilX family protein [Desulfonatronovibrio hydrogenovorans]|uniref:pilus assembly PilX family protein n=1 Tax=Desulfonatronovibrio hydrogenovorans TaxID=53245 RepID=UPI00048C3F5D|nr:pilus assembly PilX N-terminal domain-containing protein [Desulfonatronovibrio hydrogenovorans]
MYKTDFIPIQGDGQHGAALVMALLIMLVLSIIIIGFSTDVDLDLKISRNLQLKNQAFNWAETGLEVSEELVAYSMDTRGEEPQDFLIHNSYLGQVTDGPLFLTNKAKITIASGQDLLAEVDVQYMGSRPGEGGSIIIAAGYEGIGKGAGSSGGLHSYFQLGGRGFERHNSRQDINTMYRHVLR